MKKQFLFAALAVATLFTACSKEEELNQNNGTTPVNFVIGGVGSRTATTYNEGNYTTVFEENDEIGMFASGSATATTNSKFVVGSEATSMTGTPISYTEGSDATFTAYSPYQEGETSTVSLTVSDQTTAETFDNYDFMSATNTISTGNTVTFNFEHQMAMVQVTMAGTIGTTADNLSLTNVQPTLTWTAESNSVATSGTITDIKMYQIATNVFVAMIPAQSVSSAMFKTEIGTKVYTFTPNSAVSLSTGKVAKFTITIDEESSTVTQEVSEGTLTAKAWTVDTTNDNITFEKTETTKEPVEIVNLTSFENVTLGSITTWASSEGWNAWVTSPATALITDNALSLNRNEVNSTSWWNACAVNYTRTDLSINDLYKLTFHVKNAGESTARLYLRVVNRVDESSQYIGIYNSSAEKFYTAAYAQLNAGGETDCVCYINMGVYAINTGDSAEATLTTSSLPNVHFVLAPNANANTNNVEFIVSTFKLEKVYSLEQ